MSKQTDSLYHRSYAPQTAAGITEETSDRFESTAEGSERGRLLLQNEGVRSVSFEYTAESTAPAGWWKELEATRESPPAFSSTIAFEGVLPERFLALLTTLGQIDNIHRHISTPKQQKR